MNFRRHRQMMSGRLTKATHEMMMQLNFWTILIVGDCYDNDSGLELFNGNFDEQDDCHGVSIDESKNDTSNSESVQVDRQILYQPKISSISYPRLKIPIVLQCPKEARTRYLLRFPNLYQEFMNSSNVEKLKFLLYDTLTEDCVYHILTSPPMMGIEKVYEMQCATLLSSPDFYLSISDIKYYKRRILTCLGTSFGTLHTYHCNLNSQSNKEASFCNFLGMPLHKLDDFHQIQKQKYDRLVSKKKSNKI